MHKKLIFLTAIFLFSTKLIHTGSSPFDDDFTEKDYEEALSQAFRSFLRKLGFDIPEPPPSSPAPSTLSPTPGDKSKAGE